MDRFLRDAVPVELAWEFRRWENGRVLSVERLDGVCERLYGERTYTVHRADLLDTVKAAVPEEWVRLGTRCTAVEEQPDGVLLHFADGSKAEADVVIGADGVHSVVRATVAEPSTPEYSGLCAFRTLVPAERAPAFALRRAHTLWLGPGRHLVHYPVNGEGRQRRGLRPGRGLYRGVLEHDRLDGGVPGRVHGLGPACDRPDQVRGNPRQVGAAGPGATAAVEYAEDHSPR